MAQMSRLWGNELQLRPSGGGVGVGMLLHGKEFREVENGGRGLLRGKSYKKMGSSEECGSLVDVLGEKHCRRSQKVRRLWKTGL